LPARRIDFADRKEAFDHRGRGPADRLRPAVPVAVPVVPADTVPEAIPPGFDAQRVRTDLETSARQRFGDALTDQALAAPVYLLSKHYMGLSPPPIVQPDGSYKYPDPLMAMLIRENGRWLAATTTGWRPAKAEKATEIDALIADRAFWVEPAWTQPGCTDAGGSLLMLKVPPRAPIVRQGACGATQRTERLVFLGLEA
jgi:hypothetical protein